MTCKQHIGNPLILYCKEPDCETFICEACVQSHPKHTLVSALRLISLESVAKGLSDAQADEFDITRRLHDLAHENSQTASEAATHMQQAVEAIMTEVRRKLIAVKEKFFRSESQRIARHRQVVKALLEEMSRARERVERYQVVWFRVHRALINDKAAEIIQVWKSEGKLLLGLAVPKQKSEDCAEEEAAGKKPSSEASENGSVDGGDNAMIPTEFSPISGSEVCCPKKHLAKHLKSNGKFKCSNCGRKNLSKADGYWRCEECRWNFCQNCSNVRPIEIK